MNLKSSNSIMFYSITKNGCYNRVVVNQHFLLKTDNDLALTYLVKSDILD